MKGSEERFKIVFIIGSLDSGGAERHLIELVGAMDKRIFHPVIYCMGKKGALADQVETSGVAVRAFDYAPAKEKGTYYSVKEVYSLLMKMRKSLVQDSPHIVHAYLFWGNTFGAIAAKLAGIKRIITSRRSMGLFKDGKPHMQWIENSLNLITDRVTVNSGEVYRDTLNREKFVEKKLELIYNGVDINKFIHRPQSKNIKQQLNIPQDHIVVTKVANLAYIKGHRELLEAVSIILRQQSNITFLLIGRDRGIQDDLVLLSEKLGVSNHVKFLGDRGNVEDYLNISDIQVLCSYEEGFSNAILEGMACSLPLVVTDVGGNSEAVEDGANGIVIPAKDSHALAEALLKLVRDREGRVRMGTVSRRRVEKLFNTQIMYENYKNLYLTLLTEKRRNKEDEGERIYGPL